MKEIEYKFLVDIPAWEAIEKPEPELIVQGYISRTESATVRVRTKGSRAYITVKGRTVGHTRPEFEYAIPVEDALEMLDLFTQKSIRKKRYHIPHHGRTWEVDEFMGKLDGLVLAELEVASEDESFDLPDWVDRDVSGDPQYLNAVLIERS